ncbi:MAG: TlpA family protein disulfide reductase [Planctomycetota bacterium]|jgi:hypothetical protein
MDRVKWLLPFLLLLAVVAAIPWLRTSRQTGPGPDLLPGVPLPAFKAEDHSGRTWDSEGLRGKIVLLHFWGG